MIYAVTFLEGIMTFISPCFLPLIPLYLSYFSAGSEKKSRPLPNALSFIAGFTVMYTAMGLIFGLAGAAIANNPVVNVVCGVIIILFGLSYLGLFKIPFLRGMESGRDAGSIVSAFVFGVIFSISASPCTGVFLGSALTMAANSASALKGASLLAVYSLGLGVPLFLSAILIDRLKGTFKFIKRHYKVINTVCGVFLIVLGLLIALGLMNNFIALVS